MGNTGNNKVWKIYYDIIEKEDIDIVHARSRAPAFSSFLASHKKKVAFVTTCHGYYSKHIFSRVMGWGKLIIVASQVIAKHMIEDFGTPRERTAASRTTSAGHR